MVDDGDLDFAIMGACDAMFYAARAALLADAAIRTKRSDVLAAFGEAFIETGCFEEARYESLHRAFLDRSEAEHGLRIPVREVVERGIAEATDFVVAASELVRRGGVDV
jgi:uncharacterized protein (UPF0332 family)